MQHEDKSNKETENKQDPELSDQQKIQIIKDQIASEKIFEVYDSPIHGKGARALQFIPEGTPLIQYRGELIDAKTCDVRSDEYEKKGHTVIYELEDGRCIDAGIDGNNAQFFNHSCDPNCEYDEIGSFVFIKTTRDVREGEELMCDYAFEEDYGKVECKCESWNCRGTINELSEEEQKLPKRYEPEVVEPKIRLFWNQRHIFEFNDEDDETPIYSIDTPPPTVSGKMHMGHAFSYSQTDFIARYKRMKGFSIFYPFGTDDNGLATERLIEKQKGVKGSKMDRQEFINLCLETLKDLRKQYVEDWKRIGISCDWDIFYSTIDEHVRKVSQASFLDLVSKGAAYRKEAPVMWDPVLQTALAQVELDDREQDSTFNDIIFKTQDGKEVVIATTRPEMLSACVAVFIHPSDEKNKHLLGQQLTVPVYHHNVEVKADQRVDPEKGTGIVMCCTFGDQTDIEWYKAYNLPLRVAITKNGFMTELAEKYAGMKIKEARKQILEDMKASGELKNQKAIKHTVKVGERSGAEIEILETPQWFIRYLDIKEQLLDAGNNLNWFPGHMKVRYDHWIQGLQWDWCISRQRFFGVPFPVWYSKKTGEPIFATENQLPVDPLKDMPAVLPEDHTPDDIAPETDVLDTWATSSLTPQITAELFREEGLYDKLYPMSLRPQAHDIITFWLFNTVVKSHLHEGKLPWDDVVISGFALDPHGKKMSKSKGNVVEPQGMIEKYSADALRFWAAGSKLGEDLPFQEKDLVTGKKFTTKLWNSFKFAHMHLEKVDEIQKPQQFTIIDTWLLSQLSTLITNATQSFENYEYSRTKNDTEYFFWHIFCDNYLELVKDRLYNPDNYTKDEIISAQYTLYTSLFTILKLMAPITPFITEEIYLRFFEEYEEDESIHVSEWPEPILEDENAEKLGNFVVDVLSAVRKKKSEENVSLKKEVEKIDITANIHEQDFNNIKKDLTPLTACTNITYNHSDVDEFSIDITL